MVGRAGAFVAGERRWDVMGGGGVPTWEEMWRLVAQKRQPTWEEMWRRWNAALPAEAVYELASDAFQLSARDRDAPAPDASDPKEPSG